MQIEGTSALVTGGGSGLGEATARLLAKRGARVALLDLGRSKGAEVGSDLGSAALFCEGDVTREAEIEAALDDAAASFGPVRMLVNCAGIGSAARTVGKEATPFPLDVIRRTIEVNLIGTFNAIRLTAARMVEGEAWLHSSGG